MDAGPSMDGERARDMARDERRTMGGVNHGDNYAYAFRCAHARDRTDRYDALSHGDRRRHCDDDALDTKRARTDAAADDTGTFRWRKKEALEERQGLSRAEAARRDAERRAAAAREAERMSQRRLQRERAQRDRDAMQTRRMTAADDAASAEWIAQEDAFMLQQAKTRAAIRQRERRAKPIDIAVLNLLCSDPAGADAADEELDQELGAPYDVLQTLLPSELDELYDDASAFARLERDPRAMSYWSDVLLLCNERRMARGRAERLDPSIAAETDALLADKTDAELLELQTSIRTKLASGEPLEVEYWESMLRRIVSWRAVARLRAVHAAMCAARAQRVQERQRLEAQRQHAAMAEELEAGAVPLDAPRDTWDAAEMEPAPRDASQLTPEERALPRVTVAAQRAAIVAARRRVLGRPYVPRAAAPASAEAHGADAMEHEAARAMGVDEEAFNEDVRIVQPASKWEDKYRARKPRYFNRVHTGFEWNRYNQTHYDAANPPPKVVQGYKFNIFYPDLIDPTQAPTYRVVRDTSDGDTVLLRFSAGPPYEDVGFRIVDREWDFSHKRGFRCVFERGVLQLYCTCGARHILTQSTSGGSNIASR